MRVIINCSIPEQCGVVNQTDVCMSPLGTPEEPGKSQDVNVFGMEFLLLSKLSMVVNTSIHRFRLSRNS